MLSEAFANKELKDHIKNQWDYCASKYAQRVGYELSPQLKTVWINELTKAMANQRKQKVLDVGTGPGFLALLYEEMGHDCIGIDFSEEMIQSARKLAKQKGFDTWFLRADAEQLPFDDHSFDVVTNRHVVWTLTNPQKAMVEWVRVLKPGGRLIILEGDWSEGHLGMLDQIKSIAGKRINKWQRRRKTSNDDQSQLMKIKDNKLAGAFEEIKKELPLRCVTAEKLKELMRNAGIETVNQQDLKRLIRAEIQARPFGYRLTYNKNRFMIIGHKAKE